MMRQTQTRLTLAVALAMTAITAWAQAGFGTARPMNDGWRFVLDDDSAAALPAYDDSRWQHVSLPHDWSCTLPMSPDAGSCQGYLHGGIAWYRCHFAPPRSERTYIYFEGIYNRATVYVNGHKVGYRPSGYAPQLYDVTPYLSAAGQAENIVSVRVDHSRENDARWYTGSGINRPVWLITAAHTHFEPWGTAWSVKSLSRKKAVVDVTLTLNDEAKKSANATTLVEILDADGNVAARHKGGLRHTITISNPHLWSVATPYLYKIRARLMIDGRETDVSESPLGLRTFTFSPDRGFALNGEWMKVKGVCVHDDAGVLGTAVPTAVWRQRLSTLKSIGVNAIRMSHNPHATAVYALCDTLGMLVMDEASDEWEFPKRKWLKGWNKGTPGFEGTYDYFEEWIDRDVADMGRRDRCHPSIFLWSIGNEVDYPNDPYTHPVLDRGGSDFTQPMYGGYKAGQPNAERIGIIAQRLTKVVRQIDDTRAVTGALAGVVMSNETAYPEAVDVVGYNYTESRYVEDHRHYPQRIIYGSENRHDLPAWKAVRDNEHIFGQFLWTGIDYLGESGPWPARGSEAGLLDLAGRIKPIGHYRAALWAEHPVCYIGTYPADRPDSHNYRGRENRQWVSPYATATWNYDEGQRVRVVCYTNAPSARLLLNDEPVGGQPRRDEATDILYWDIDYAPGTLRCEAIDATAQTPAAMATASVTTCGRPYALRATADKPSLSSADDVVQVTVEVVDEAGRVIPLADNSIACRASRQLRLLGLENGDIRDLRDKTSSVCRAHGGRLTAYITRAALTPAAMLPDSHGRNATIRFTSPLLAPAEITLAIE